MWYLIDLGILMLCVGFFAWAKLGSSPLATMIRLVTLLLGVLAFGHAVTMALNGALGITHGAANLTVIALHEFGYVAFGAALMWFWKELTR